MLKVPWMKSFLKLLEAPRKAAKPKGLSKSADMKMGSSLWLDACKWFDQRL